MVVVAIVGLTAGALSACGVPAPTPTVDAGQTETPTPAETVDAAPAPEPGANVSSIVIDGDSVSVNISEGGQLIDIPFTTDPATAAAQLSEAIGLQPITTTTPAASCGGGLQKVTWGAISFYSPYPAAPGGAQFYAQADSKSTSNGKTVAMLSGQWVGSDGAATIAANAAAPLLEFGGGIQILAYDVKAGTVDSGPDDFYGASAVIKNNVLDIFTSPVNYYYDC